MRGIYSREIWSIIMVIDSVGPLSYLQRNLFSDVIVRTNLTRRTNPDFIFKEGTVA